MITDSLKSILAEELGEARFNCAALAVIDFNSHKYESFEIINKNPNLKVTAWFDLASLTKPLTLAGAWLSNPKSFNDEMILLLEHRGGLPFWGRLSTHGWKETVTQYEVKESEVVYSDFSALRLSLELQKKHKDFYSLTDKFRDSEVCFWKEIPEYAFCPVTGWRGGQLISGQVHDDNCFVIGEKVGHAGLFGTVDGLARTLINYDQSLKMIDTLTPLLSKRTHRYVRGFDTVQDLNETLAGQGCSDQTFGHLGFTGTSFWIDPTRRLGWVLLTNGSYPYWYDRLKLNQLRRRLGSYIWAAP